MASSATYGAFVDVQTLQLDGSAFKISALEARSMDPQQTFVLHAGYSVLAAAVGHDLDTTAV